MNRLLDALAFIAYVINVAFAVLGAWILSPLTSD
jgi:hypothetical protein